VRKRDRKVRRLRSLELFADCTDDELSAIASAADLVSVAAGDVLARHDSSPSAFVLLEGTAVVDESLVLAPGTCFGTVALLDNDGDDGELRMLTHGVVLVIGRREFAGLLVAVPSFAMAIAKDLSRRLREQHERNHAGANNDR
jgi:CRP-like cAMP-binding protein